MTAKSTPEIEIAFKHIVTCRARCLLRRQRKLERWVTLRFSTYCRRLSSTYKGYFKCDTSLEGAGKADDRTKRPKPRQRIPESRKSTSRTHRDWIMPCYQNITFWHFQHSIYDKNIPFVMFLALQLLWSWYKLTAPLILLDLHSRPSCIKVSLDVGYLG